MLRVATKLNRPIERLIETKVSDAGPNGYVSLDGAYVFEGEW